MKFKQWFWEDATQSADGYGDDLAPTDNGLYEPAGHERVPVPRSEKADKVFGVKVRPADKRKKSVKSFVITNP